MLSDFNSYKEKNKDSESLQNSFKKWVKPYSGNKSYFQDYISVQKTSQGLTFLDEIGSKIDNNYTYDLPRNSSYNSDFANFRNFGLVKIVNDSNTVLAITFTDIGQAVWDIRKFIIAQGE